MKKYLFTIAAAFLAATSFANNNVDPTEKVADKKVVKTEESTITWKAYKVTGSHEGTINLASGNLEFDNNTLTGGAFVVDMTTINTTDLEGEYKDPIGTVHPVADTYTS